MSKESKKMHGLFAVKIVDDVCIHILFDKNTFSYEMENQPYDNEADVSVSERKNLYSTNIKISTDNVDNMLATIAKQFSKFIPNNARADVKFLLGNETNYIRNMRWSKLTANEAIEAVLSLKSDMLDIMKPSSICFPKIFRC
jgi:hypothetical protein